MDPYQTKVLNPCPTCGMRFDISGCMTFMDSFLEKIHGGNCPECGIRVVIRLPLLSLPELWEQANTHHEIRAIEIENLGFSVRTTNSLAQLGITTVGELLDGTKAQIRNGVLISDSVIAEVERLLATKDLSLADD